MFGRLLDATKTKWIDLIADLAGRMITATTAPLEQRIDVGALSASAIAITDALDLGPKETRQHTRVIFSKYGSTSAGEFIVTEWSDDGVTWNIHLPAGLGNNPTTNAYSAVSSAAMHVQGISLGRYVRMKYNNGDTPQTALRLSVTAIAGI